MAKIKLNLKSPNFKELSVKTFVVILLTTLGIGMIFLADNLMANLISLL